MSVSSLRVLAGFLAVVAGLPAASAGASAAAQSNPKVTQAFPSDFPDPFVFVHDDHYYAFATQVRSRNVPVMWSKDLKSWTSPVDALPDLPRWAEPGKTWAPAVIEHGGQILLYYTVTEGHSNHQCISVAKSVATATDPAPKFKDTSLAPLVCQHREGGSTGPYPFVDRDSSLYLLWKNDGNAANTNRATKLWVQKLASDGQSFAAGSTEKVLLAERPSRWHVPIEAPAMVRLRDKKYVLFYGGGLWNSAGSGIGYASCEGPLGPCEDQTKDERWLKTDPPEVEAIGPQGPTLFTDRTSGAMRIGFSGWSGTPGGPSSVRPFWIGGLCFKNGRPNLCAPAGGRTTP